MGSRSRMELCQDILALCKSIKADLADLRDQRRTTTNLKSNAIETASPVPQAHEDPLEILQDVTKLFAADDEDPLEVLQDVAKMFVENDSQALPAACDADPSDDVISRSGSSKGDSTAISPTESVALRLLLPPSTTVSLLCDTRKHNPPPLPEPDPPPLLVPDLVSIKPGSKTAAIDFGALTEESVDSTSPNKELQGDISGPADAIESKLVAETSEVKVPVELAESHESQKVSVGPVPQWSDSKQVSRPPAKPPNKFFEINTMEGPKGLCAISQVSSLMMINRWSFSILGVSNSLECELRTKGLNSARNEGQEHVERDEDWQQMSQSKQFPISLVSIAVILSNGSKLASDEDLNLDTVKEEADTFNAGIWYLPATGTSVALFICDMKSKTNITKFEGQVGAVTAISSSENGYILAIAALERIKLWYVLVFNLYFEDHSGIVYAIWIFLLPPDKPPDVILFLGSSLAGFSEIYEDLFGACKVLAETPEREVLVVAYTAMIVKIQETCRGIGGMGVGLMLICFIVEFLCCFFDEIPVVLLSTMGKTINKLLLAGVRVVSDGVLTANKVHELWFIKDLHCRATNELGINRLVLLQLLKSIAMMKGYLVSVENCMSTRILAAYLYKIVIKARQYDAFTNVEILKINYPAVVKRLLGDWVQDPTIPIVINFVEKGWEPTAILTLGTESSDLMAPSSGKAFSLPEIQLWKDIGVVLIGERSIYSEAMSMSRPMPNFTCDKVLKLRSCWNVAVSCMLGQLGLLIQAFAMVEERDISVDVLASSEIIDSWILDQSKFGSNTLIQPELDHANWCGSFKKCRPSYNEPKARFLCSVFGIAHGSRGIHSCRFDSLFELLGFSQSRPPEEEGSWRFEQAMISGLNLEDKVDFEGERVDKNMGQQWAGPNDLRKKVA